MHLLKEIIDVHCPGDIFLKEIIEFHSPGGIYLRKSQIFIVLETFT